jgi:hypothetical protein
MTTMEEMIKLNMRQAQERETRMEEYLKSVQDREKQMSERYREKQIRTFSQRN